MQDFYLACDSKSLLDSRSSEKRGLPHPAHCPLCDQEDENIQHILTSCVFARQFWFNIMQPLNLSSLVTNPGNNLLCSLVEEVLEESTETC